MFYNIYQVITIQKSVKLLLAKLCCLTFLINQMEGFHSRNQEYSPFKCQYRVYPTWRRRHLQRL